MLALALDTTTPGGSCAVVRDGTVLVETEGDPAVSHAARLPGDLMRALEACRLTLRDVDVFAVATGPGSFTGLRVGIATMQGLAAAAGRPLAGVSAFDAMVRLVHTGALGSVSPGAQVATWVDAWRGEVYAARYEATEAIDAPSVEPPSRVLDRLASTHAGPIVFVGSGAQRCADAIRAALGVRAVLAEPVAPAVAAAVGRLALEDAARGVAAPPDEIRPLYVRRVDDEGSPRVAAC
jgi:tRNA threonylcarbamoyladenosine biosynthesis protein TsaB